MEHELVCHGDNLFGSIWSFSGCRVFHGIIDMIEEVLDGVVCVIGRTKFGIVVLQISWRNLGVRGVQVIQKFAHGSRCRYAIVLVRITRQLTLREVCGGLYPWLCIH